LLDVGQTDPLKSGTLPAPISNDIISSCEKGEFPDVSGNHRITDTASGINKWCNVYSCTICQRKRSNFQNTSVSWGRWNTHLKFEDL